MYSLGVFLVEISRYRTVLLKKHSCNHIGWTSSFSEKKRVNPLVPSVH